MNIITISREFGSGGRELGRRLADALGWDYYDRELITAIAGRRGLDERYLEKTLDHHVWQTAPLTFRRTFAGVPPLQAEQTGLLLEQKRVVEKIGEADRSCVIVGRNADVLLADRAPFRIFVCAGMDARLRRCAERAEAGERLSQRELERNIRRIDRDRAKTREILTGSRWGERGAYHLTVNTTDWEIKELTPAVEQFATRWFGRTT